MAFFTNTNFPIIVSFNWNFLTINYIIIDYFHSCRFPGKFNSFIVFYLKCAELKFLKIGPDQ